MVELQRGVISDERISSTPESSQTILKDDITELILKRQLETPKVKVSYLTLYRYASAQDIVVLLVASLSAVISGALLPSMTIIFGTLASLFRDQAISAISQDDFNSKLNEYSLYFVYLMIGMFFFSFITTAGFLRLGESLTDSIREQYLKSLLRQNIAYYDLLGPGTITTSLTGQMNLIQKGLSEKVGLTLTAVATFIAAFIIGFMRSARLTGILVSVVIAICLDMGIGARYTVKYSKHAIDSTIRGGSIAEEVLSSVRDATAFSSQERLAKHYNSFLVVALKWGYKKAAIEAILLAIMFFIVNANYALSFWEGSRLIASGEASLSAVLTVLLSVMLGSFSLGNVAPNMSSMFASVSAASSIFATIDRESPIDASSTSGQDVDIQGDIEFRNVRHIYPSRPEVEVLHSFSATFLAGKTTALAGLSGSGKSTIIGLLERFYSPVAGEILVDGVPIESLNLRCLRSQMRLVNQEPVLFAQTIFENVANGLVGTAYENASESKKNTLVEYACRLANAHDFVVSLPEQYNTNVGDKGYLMSGGQRQRLAIARAVISQPKVLILDEATSALDTTAEAEVQQSLDRAAAGRTTIVIAHRLSTIKNADNIIVMSHGNILEQGTHDELLEKEGNYFDLVKSQSLKSLKSLTSDESDESCVMGHGEKVEKDRADYSLAQQLRRSQSNRSSISLEEEQEFGFWSLFKFVAQFNKKERCLSLFGCIMSIFGGLVNPAQASLFAFSITAMSVPTSEYDNMRKNIDLFSGLFFMLACLHALFYLADNLIFGVTSERLIRRVRLDTFRQFMRQEIGWFDQKNNSPGSLVAFLSAETTHLAGISGTTLSTLISITATVIGSFVLALIVGWKLGLVIGACLPVLIACGYLRIAMLNRFNDRIEHVYQEVGNYACEATSLIRTVASLTREREICREYRKRLVKQRRHSLRAIAWSSMLYASSQSLNFGVIALAFWYGGRLLSSGEYSTMQFFLSYSAVIFGSQGAGVAFAQSPDISNARNAAKRLMKLFKRKSKTNWHGGDRLLEVNGLIEMKDVTFHFPTRPNQQILKGLNLTVKPGQFVALVGPSGCGKSTTISLLERFYDPTGGTICIDGRDIASVNIKDYRQHISLVSQEPVLYSGSVRENIVIGMDREVGDEELAEACKQANIYDFILSLPNGFATVVGSKGSLLSTGQKQRICIARALIRNPRVLLLDEATSALDSESEKLVQAALDAAAMGRSTLAIAHRLSTIQNADLICVFDNGNIVEQGTHRELMERKGKYFELVNLQSLGT